MRKNQSDRKILLVQALSSPNSRRNIVVIKKTKKNSIHLHLNPTPSSKPAKRSLPDSEHTKSGTLRSKYSIPTPKCRPVSKNPSSPFHLLRESAAEIPTPHQVLLNLTFLSPIICSYAILCNSQNHMSKLAHFIMFALIFTLPHGFYA